MPARSYENWYITVDTAIAVIKKDDDFLDHSVA